MLEQAKANRIQELAAQVNETSEMYQFIHAMFAIEKMYRDDSSSQYKVKVGQILDRLSNPALGVEEREDLVREAKNLKEVYNKKINILVDYIPQIQENSARITWTQSNTFMIVLPKSMESTRGADGKINFDVLAALRKLMAHELGHIVLHSGLFDSPCDVQGGHKQIEISTVSEEEAELFASVLISLRRDRNAEIYEDGHFKNI